MLIKSSQRLSTGTARMRRAVKPPAVYCVTSAREGEWNSFSFVMTRGNGTQCPRISPNDYHRLGDLGSLGNQCEWPVCPLGQLRVLGDQHHAGLQRALGHECGGTQSCGAPRLGCGSQADRSGSWFQFKTSTSLIQSEGEGGARDVAVRHP